MADVVSVRRDTYFDSVALMLVSRDAAAIEGVDQASAVAATPLNLELLQGQSFSLPEDLGSNDLVIAIRAETEAAAQAALAAVEGSLAEQRRSAPGGHDNVPARSLRSAARRHPDLSLAFISVPGRFAAYEVAQALQAGLHVFCFSDGVPLQDEVALKRRAAELDLLFMGPDCGTAIIDGVGLGFANAVQRGPVGVVGASGTGIQELTCLLDAAGVGISHAIGVGGRDLNREVGGLMTMAALKRLAEDVETKVIAIVSKPPDTVVAAGILKAAAASGKPVVMALPGLTGPLPQAADVHLTATLEAGAQVAAELAGGRAWREAEPQVPTTPGLIRGLFSGGTLCTEAMTVVAQAGQEVRSNIPLRPEWRLGDSRTSEGHCFIDFGDDELTQGRAHPMIDPSLRNDRFQHDASDPAVGVMVLDVVLGYGAHPDPAADLAPLIRRALRERPGGLTVCVSLCAAAPDNQGVEGQRAQLREAGAVVGRSAAGAARAALRAAGLA
ncbi:MAG: acyl-CoA synthetase FdrA [Candidatus Dormibacteraeota bacterium]|uniref:Acyl-CoA synthetase FdrA n=1 Tax=Candidatus Dormiibacter inghamiae TaxID=3127013 RepID=A0A934NHZ5_9BACT|nr:acyl-CoA synthetase FdrA [Candidatus Dormibacteraeota bacterium]MBJ7606360.1 acyl-CoA synthetase FdrA [Candidatus Dormibacteraeota bacterium]